MLTASYKPTMRQVPLHEYEEPRGYLVGYKDLIIYYITTIWGKRGRNNVNRRTGQIECKMRWYTNI